jgi:hypothetical protein
MSPMSNARYDAIWNEWVTHCATCLAIIRGETLDITNLKLQYHAARNGCEKYAANTSNGN